MVDVHITVDEKLLDEVDRVSEPLGLDRSEVVNQALQVWLRSHTLGHFEQEWIAALQKEPDDARRAEIWMDAQVWEEN